MIVKTCSHIKGQHLALMLLTHVIHELRGCKVHGQGLAKKRQAQLLRLPGLLLVVLVHVKLRKRVLYLLQLLRRVLVLLSLLQAQLKAISHL